MLKHYVMRLNIKRYARLWSTYIQYNINKPHRLILDALVQSVTTLRDVKVRATEQKE